MLTYMALDGEPQAYRSAQLKALQAYFAASAAQPFANLPSNAMSPSNNARGIDLIINSYGNASIFAGYDPRSFLRQLYSKGFHSGSFKRLFLVASHRIGANTEPATITSFALNFKKTLVSVGIDSELYATRGSVICDFTEIITQGQPLPVVTRTVVKAPDGEYPLGAAMLLIE